MESGHIDFEDNGTFKWGMGKDQFSNFYINDAFSGTERVKIDYQNEDIHLRGNVIVDSIYGSGSVVNAGKFKMRTGATNGYIPVSDSDGEMTWTDPSTVISAGDMNTSIYDTNTDDVVDNAEKVNNLTVETAVPANALFTDNQDASEEITTTLHQD